MRPLLASLPESCVSTAQTVLVAYKYKDSVVATGALRLPNACLAWRPTEKGGSRRGRTETESAEGDSASSVSASTLGSLRDDFGDEELANEHPFERVIDALYEKRWLLYQPA